MKLDEIRKELEGVVFAELRTDANNDFAAVILNNELAKLTASLERIFGTPAWPSRNRLLPGVREIINGFGGIRPGQTLYFWQHGKDTALAMLWPWQDGERTTLKIIKR